MKTIIQTLLCAALILLPNYGFAQTLGYKQATDMDVSGIFIGGTYTKAQVLAQWGEPAQYWGESSEFGLSEVYDYVIDQLVHQFHFGDNGVFHTFNIRTSHFVVYTAFSGGIKVGDPISRIQSIGLGTPVLQSDGTYRLGQGDDPLVFYHSNGIITRIYFMTSV